MDIFARRVLPGEYFCPLQARSSHLSAYTRELGGTFYELNKGFGLWDIKRNMRRTIGVGVVLCGEDGCSWFDYSTPGNILFGFTAASVGVPEEFSMAAGGLLEIREGAARIENYATLFEDPQDAAAVHFGYHLYFRYGSKIGQEHFKASFTKEVQKHMQQPPVGFVPPGPALPQKNRYPVGAFNYTR